MELFERPSGGERAVLVHVAFESRPEEGEIAEFSELAKSAGAEPVALVTASRSQPDPKSFVGSGKLDEIREILEAESGLSSMSPSMDRRVRPKAKDSRVFPREKRKRRMAPSAQCPRNAAPPAARTIRPAVMPSSLE